MPKRYLHTLITFVLLLSLLALVLPPLTTQAAQGLDRDALRHDSRDDRYRTPGGAVPTETAVTLRFRTAANRVDSVVVNLYSITADEQILVPMAVVNTTPDGYDWWEITFDTGRRPTIYTYHFLITAGDQTLFYEDDTRPPDGTGIYVPAHKGGPGTPYAVSPNLAYQITVYDPDFYTPEWMRNAVIYQIFPDRFRNGDPTNDPADGDEVFYGELPLYFHETWNEPPLDGRIERTPSGADYFNSDFFGGDLAGIIDKLDYLEKLGVTAIYLNPIFEARSNHRYDTADFKAIDPILGDLATFNTLVADAEARGMVLILDGVFNHLSSDSYFFDRYHRFDIDGACESLDSPYRDWFFFVPPRGQQPDACVDNPNHATYYISWGGFDSIPKINSDLLEPRLYFFLDEDSVARQWGRTGIGGWRLDVASDIDSGGGDSLYWESFRSVVREINPEAVIIGEEWGDATPWLLGHEWDSTMNYRLRTGILGFVRDSDYVDNDANADRLIRALSPSQADALIRAIEEDYPPAAYHAMMNLLGSHDTSRLRFVVDDFPQAQQLAALMQFTLPGAPTVYYGDEIALDAPSISDGSRLQDDPYNRASYPWPDASGNHYPPPDEDMLAYYQQIAALRHANPALREGDMITLLTDDDSGVYAYLRRDAAAGNAALVVLNNGSAPQDVTLSLAGLVPAGLTLDPVFAAESVEITGDPLTVSVNATSGNVWTVSADIPFSTLDTPVDFEAQGENGGVILTWDAVPDAASYLVYRSPVPSGGLEPLAKVTQPGHIDETTVNGFRYYYAVAAVGADGLTGEPTASALAIPSAPISETYYPADDGTNTPILLPLVIGATTTLEAAIVIDDVTAEAGATRGVRAQAALVDDPALLDNARWQPMHFVADRDGADVYAAEFPARQAGQYLLVARFSTDAGRNWQMVTHRDGSLPTLIIEESDDTTPPDAPAAAQVQRATLSGVIVTWEDSDADDLYTYRVYRTDADGVTELLDEIPPGDTNRYVDRAVVEGADYRYGIAAVDSSLNESDPAITEEVRVEQGMVPVTFRVTVPDYTPAGDVLFIAGAFGSGFPHWDPAGLEMEQIDTTHWQITLDLPEGRSIEYKFVRNGTWEAVEKGPDCEEIANRKLNVVFGEAADALIVEHTVDKWRDLDACG